MVQLSTHNSKIEGSNPFQWEKKMFGAFPSGAPLEIGSNALAYHTTDKKSFIGKGADDGSLPVETL